jgi:hypothetical protein
MEKQEEISRFISRFDCLALVFFLRLPFGDFFLFSRPQKTVSSPFALGEAQCLGPDTNSIELKSKIEEKTGERASALDGRSQEEKYLKSKLFVLLVNSSLGKYSIKIVEMEFREIFSSFFFGSLVWHGISIRLCAREKVRPEEINEEVIKLNEL